MKNFIIKPFKYVWNKIKFWDKDESKENEKMEPDSSDEPKNSEYLIPVKIKEPEKLNQ